MTGTAEIQIHRLETFLNQWEKRFAEWATGDAPVAPRVRSPEEILEDWVCFTPLRSAASIPRTGSGSGEIGIDGNPSLDLLDALVSGDS